MRSVLKGLWILAAVGAAVSGASGFGRNKVVYKDFDWHVYTSPHFEVHYYPEEEEFLQRVVSDAESAYVRISQFLDHEIDHKVPLIYYRTHGDFEQTNVELSEIPQAVGAFAEPFLNRIVIPIDQPPDRFAAVLRHELVHIFEFSIFYDASLRRTLRSSPQLWIMEGLASYIGEDESNIDRMVIRDAVVNNYIPPVKVLDPNFVDGFLVYRFGHAIFDYIESAHGKEGVRNFLFEYRKVLVSGNLEKAFKEAFGYDFDTFDRKFGKYLRKKYFPLLMEKDEPLDAGPDIGLKKPHQYTFSPTLSPSGELIAALGTPGDELDVVILSANDGKVIRNLTRGFSNKYEEIVTGAFDGLRDLSWSPDGDQVAFFVRKENRRPLLIFDALTGKRLDEIETGLDNGHSPAFSPDGTRIAFSANRNGIVDIFVLDLATRVSSNATDDPYFDTNPSWSADGKDLLYNRRVGMSEKVFLVDAADPASKRQLTFGDSNDIMPVFGRDPGTIVLASDRWGGIYNLCRLDLETLELGRLTDLVGGAFSPVQLADKDETARLAYVGYAQGTFRLYTMDFAEPQAIAPAEPPTGAPETLAYRPDLNLTLDEKSKKPYKKKWSVDAPDVALGAASDGTIFSSTYLTFADLLGDHRILVSLQTVGSYTNTHVQYTNLKRRLQWAVEVFDDRDYYAVSNPGESDVTREDSHVTGAYGSARYPLSRYYRVEGQLGYVNRTLAIPFLVQSDGYQIVEFDTIKDQFAIVGASFSGDTTRFKSFGPYHGKRFTAGIVRAEQISGDSGSATNGYLDFRGYASVTRRSLLALRVSGVTSVGDGAGVYSLGGYNDLRGYDFRELFGNRMLFSNLELRFPLIDELRFPFGSIQQFRGTIFLDAGTAFYNNRAYYSQRLGTYRDFGKVVDLDNNGSGDVYIPTGFVPFDWYDSENGRLQDLRASWGIGFHFLLFGFEWHWDFAHQLPYTDFRRRCLDGLGDQVSCASFDDVRGVEMVKVEVQDSGPRTNFWIGFSF